MSIRAFGEMLGGLARNGRTLGKVVAQRINVPYYEDREEDRFLGHRLKTVPEEEAVKQGLLTVRRFRCPDGSILETEDFPEDPRGYEQLTEEVWTRDHWPDNANNIGGAVDKVPHGITGLYFHMPSLNLVLLGSLGEKVGIRSVNLSAYEPDISRLLDLKKAATS